MDPNYGMGFLSESPDEMAGRSDVMEWVRNCIERLPERLKLLFKLRDLDELPVPEAAAAAGVNAGSAAVMLTLARHQLCSCLQQNQHQSMNSDSQAEGSKSVTAPRLRYRLRQGARGKGPVSQDHGPVLPPVR
ncbi:MAG: hypothetical protein ACI8T1_002211 [Verrucomicrobiales bacterium]